MSCLCQSSYCMYIKSWKFSSVERSVCLPVALGCLRDGNYRLGTENKEMLLDLLLPMLELLQGDTLCGKRSAWACRRLPWRTDWRTENKEMPSKPVADHAGFATLRCPVWINLLHGVLQKFSLCRYNQCRKSEAALTGTIIRPRS